jgi:hypothetical protein
MNITLIDIGNIANDGTGDDLRTAFQKVNENFVELETSIDASTVAANVGDGIGVFKQKVENTLQFRSLGTDDKLSVVAVGDKIVISTNFQNKDITVGSLLATGSVTANSMTATMFNGSVNGNLMGRVYPLASDYIIGAGNIVGVQPNPGNPNYQPARVDGVSVRDLNNTINTFDFGTLDNQYTSAFQYLLSRVGLDLGTIISPTDLSIDAGTL